MNNCGNYFVMPLEMKEKLAIFMVCKSFLTSRIQRFIACQTTSQSDYFKNESSKKTQQPHTSTL